MIKQLRITTDIINDSAPRPRPAGHFAEAFHDTPLLPPDENWVNATWNSMTDTQRIGSLIGTHRHDIGEEMVREFSIGHFCFLGNDLKAASITERTKELRRIAKYPISFSIDGEAGPGTRLADGTTFPLLMAAAATGDVNLVREWGRATGRELGALGIDLVLAPTVDVNSEAGNPVIATRAASDSPQIVAKFAAAYIEGLHDVAMLSNLKHFPGHGASASDSHAGLPVIHIDGKEQDAVHLKPFRELQKRGLVDSVMTAHIFFPEIMGDHAMPATLDPHYMITKLRQKLGVTAPCLTDAFNMAGLFEYGTCEGERSVLAIEAGCDLIMAPMDVEAAFRGIADALESGRLTEERIEESGKRMLRMVSRRRGMVQQQEPSAILQHPAHHAVSDEIARRSITLDFAREGVLPLNPRASTLLLIIHPESKIFYRFASDTFEKGLQSRLQNLTIARIPRGIGDGEGTALRLLAGRFEQVVLASFDWTKKPDAGQMAVINDLPSAPVFVNFGSPYQVHHHDDLAAHLMGYCTLPETQRAMAEALLHPENLQGIAPICLTCE